MQNSGSDSFDQFVIIKCKHESTKGRKAVISSRVEDMQGNVLVEASYVVARSLLLFMLTSSGRGIFIEPKYANLLKATSSVGLLVGTKAEPRIPASS